VNDSPHETVTFLFTDIAGSTQLWESHPDTMRLALERHDELLRVACTTFGGSVFKTVGDSFYVAFDRAPDAVAAAVQSQRMLLDEQWPAPIAIAVRMALHTGVAATRDGDYFGQPLNRVARLLSTGHGGQILLSEATRDAVGEELPAGADLQDRGVHRLRDLHEPLGVFQVLHEALPSEFPPLRSLSTHPNNLPQQVTTFIGRDREMETIHGMIERSRLVTLTGSGGCGKSRMALQIAADALERFPDGVWLIELAALSDPHLVVHAAASALGVVDDPGKPILTSLADFLQEREILIVLDNCEHLLDACAQMTHVVLRSAPKVRFLASSREPLAIEGEASFRVPSLSSPDPRRDLTPERLYPYESVRLFLDRAVLQRSDFTLQKENAAAVAAVCHRLDGIPLALELAAARVRSMPVEQIEQRLDQRFRLLTGGSRTALPRQQTLRALIDWSYDLLDGPEQALLSRLSVFAGGWTVEAAEQVCAGGAVEEWETLDLLTSLVDKSLVTFQEHLGAARYRLLETVRQYARDRLEESGHRPEWRDRHLDHLLRIAESAEPHLRGADQMEWLEHLECEHDNLRAAIEWAHEKRDEESDLRLGAALWGFWLRRGHLSEGRERLDRSLSRCQDGDTAVRAAALNGTGVLTGFQGDYDRARELHEASLHIRRILGDDWGIAQSLNNLGLVAADQGHYAKARALYEEALAIRRRLEDLRGVAMSLTNLGAVACEQGDLEEAHAFHEESLAIQRGTGNRRGTAGALDRLAHLALRRGDIQAARSLYGESLAIFQELGDQWGIAVSLEGAAALARCESNPLQAAKIWGAAQRLREEIGVPLPPAERPRYVEQVSIARSECTSTAAFEAAWETGRGLTLDQAIDFVQRPETPHL
jgi:predicted ATPase/class 3 adenylate cyclase